MRFIAKKLGSVWCVYDIVHASYPYFLRLPEGGKVAQDHKTEEAAEAEAARLNGCLS